MKIEKILAIDFGTVRIGLAISTLTLAQPLEIIKNDEATFQNLEKICHQNQIEKIVVGISENEMARKTKVFAQELREKIASEWQSKPSMEFVDETLSSNTVHRKLKSAKKSKRSSHIDHYAAAEFLQDWLDQHY